MLPSTRSPLDQEICVFAIQDCIWEVALLNAKNPDIRCPSNQSVLHICVERCLLLTLGLFTISSIARDNPVTPTYDPGVPIIEQQYSLLSAPSPVLGEGA